MKFNTNGKDSEWSKYDGYYCEVIRPLTQDEADIEEVGPMYKVRFTDGVEIDAFEDELTADEDYPIRCTAEGCPRANRCARFTIKNTESHDYSPTCFDTDTYFLYYEDHPIVRCTSEACPRKKHCARYTSKDTETYDFFPECSNLDTHYIYYEEAPISEYISDTGEYIIPVSWEVYSRIIVKANNLEEALKKAEEQIDEIPLPSSYYQDYVDGSFKIDVPDEHYAIAAQSFTDRTDVVIE